MKLTVKTADERIIRKIAHEYLSGSYVTLRNLGIKYQTTATTISNILWRGVAENIIDSKVANYIYTKVVDKPSIGWYQRKLRWDEAFAKREKMIKELENELKNENELNYLYSLKDYYENAIESYDKYFFEEDDAPSIDFLKAKLEDVNQKIASLS